MRKDYRILNNIKGLNVFDKVLVKLLKRYTYKIYSAGMKEGFYFNE